MALLVAELLALMMWSYGESRARRLAEAGRSAAAIDIPLLSARARRRLLGCGVRRRP